MPVIQIKKTQWRSVQQKRELYWLTIRILLTRFTWKDYENWRGKSKNHNLWTFKKNWRYAKFSGRYEIEKKNKNSNSNNSNINYAIYIILLLLIWIQSCLILSANDLKKVSLSGRRDIYLKVL
jgi:hypothetical protein